MRKYVVIRMVDGYVTDVSDVKEWQDTEILYRSAYEASLEIMHDHDVRVIISLVGE